MYNRYIQGSAGRTENGEQTVNPPKLSNGPAEKTSVGLGSTISGLLGNSVDLGDILLYLILLLLYLEKKDEEILITLAALVVTNFKSEPRRRNHQEP